MKIGRTDGYFGQLSVGFAVPDRQKSVFHGRKKKAREAGFVSSDSRDLGRHLLYDLLRQMLRSAILLNTSVSACPTSVRCQ